MVDKSKNRVQLYPLGKFKDIVRKTLSQNEIIQQLILGENNDDVLNYDIEDILLGSKDLGLEGHIRDNLFIDTTQQKTKTYIFMDTYAVQVTSKLEKIVIVMNIFCHSSLLQLSNTEKAKYYNHGLFGNRADCLSDQTVRLLDGQDIGIGKLGLSSTAQGKIYQPTPTSNYYGRTLLFDIWDFR